MQHVIPSTETPQRLKFIYNAHNERNLLDIISTANRWRKALFIWLMSCLFIASFYIYITPAQFYAATQVVLEPQSYGGPSQGTNPGFSTANMDSSQIESKIQTARSERVLRFVFDELRLNQKAEFGGQFAASNTARQTSRTEREYILVDSRAFQTFLNRVFVRRIGQSRVLEIGVQSLSPALAASLANSVTAAFIRDQIQAKSLNMTANGQFLNKNIEDIKAQLAASETAVHIGKLPYIQFAAADLRIISTASEPLNKLYPKTSLILMLALTIALLTGLAAIAILHSIDRTIRSKKQIERQFGLVCLGSVLLTKNGRKRMGFAKLLTCGGKRDNTKSPFSSSIHSVRSAILGARSTNAPHLLSGLTGGGCDIESPRAIKTPSMGARAVTGPHLIGIVSCLPGEGKSTIASNLAHQIAGAGRNCVLIDGDLHNYALTEVFAPSAACGIADVLSGKNRALSTPSYIHMGPCLDFIPAVNAARQTDPGHYIDMGAWQTLFEKFRNYDLALIDLPALSTSPDVKTVAPLLHSVILVIEAGKTTMEDFAEAVETFGQANTRIIGFVLNKVEEDTLPTILSPKAWRRIRRYWTSMRRLATVRLGRAKNEILSQAKNKNYT